MATGADASFITVDADKLQSVWEGLLANPKFFETLYLDPKLAKKPAQDPKTPGQGEGGKALSDRSPQVQLWNQDDAEGFIDAVRPTDDTLAPGNETSLITYLTTEGTYNGKKAWEDLYGQTGNMTHGGATYNRLMRAHEWAMSYKGDTPLKQLKGWSTIRGHIDKALGLQPDGGPVNNAGGVNTQDDTTPSTNPTYTFKDDVSTDATFVRTVKSRSVSIQEFITSITKNIPQSLSKIYGTQGLYTANERLDEFIEGWDKNFDAEGKSLPRDETSGELKVNLGMRIAKKLKNFFDPIGYKNWLDEQAKKAEQDKKGSGAGNFGTPSTRDGDDDDDETLAQIAKAAAAEAAAEAAKDAKAALAAEYLQRPENGILKEIQDKLEMKLSENHIISFVDAKEYRNTKSKVEEILGSDKARGKAMKKILEGDEELLNKMRNNAAYSLWLRVLGYSGDA